MPFDVEHNFRLTFRGGEKTVGLKTLDPSEGENRVYFCKRYHIVWNRINPKFSLEKVLHHVLVNELGNVGQAIDGIGEIGVVVEGKQVWRGSHRHTQYVV